MQYPRKKKKRSDQPESDLYSGSGVAL